MCDNAIEKTPPASEEVNFFDTLIDGMVTSAEDVTGLLLNCVHSGETANAGAQATVPATDSATATAAASFSTYFTRLFFGDAEAAVALASTTAASDAASDTEKEDERSPDSAFSNFGGVTIGSDMSAGVVKTEKKDNGDSVQTRLTVSAGLTYRQQTKTTNPKGKLIAESDSSKAVDGSAWSTSVKYNEAGKATERNHSFEEDDWSGFSTTVKYNADGSATITRDVLSYHLGEYSESFSFSKKEIKEAQALLGKDAQKHDLLTKLGNGDAAMGLLVLKDLGNGDVQKGLAVLKRFGTTDKTAVERLLTFGTGSGQEAVQRFVRVGTTVDKALTLLEKFGEGSLEKGMWRLEQLGGIKGNAGKGISVIEDLHKGYDFQAALPNLIELAKANGGNTIDDGIKFIQSLGRGDGAEGAKAARCLGDGDAKVCITHARILSGTDAKAGFSILINELGKRYGAKHVADSLKRLNKDGTVAGGLHTATQYGGGVCRNGVCSLNDLGVNRDGEKDLNVGIDTVLSLYPDRKPGQIVDPQAALAYARTTYGKHKDEDGHLVEDCRCVTRTLLATTKDKQGTVDGADVKSSIESLSPTKDLKEAEAVLRRASDNNLIGEGVDGILSVSDDESFLSGVNNLKLASDDGTVRDGIDQVRGFSNDGRSFRGGVANIEHVDPDGSHAANINEVKAFADPDKEGVRKFSGGSFNLRNLNLEKTITENIDEVILTSDKEPDGKQSFAGGRDNIQGIYPHRPISSNIQSIIAASDVGPDGTRTFTGGRLNIERINPDAPIGVNMREIARFSDAKTEEGDFDGGIVNLQSVNPNKNISQNIDSVVSASDRGPTGEKTFLGGRSNVERINPDAPISENIQEIIQFGTRLHKGENAEPNFDGGVANLASVNPKQEIGPNIDSVIAFSDEIDSGHGWQRLFRGGRENLERVNYSRTIQENIQSVIAFSDRAPDGTGNGTTAIEALVGGAGAVAVRNGGRTFDGGRINIELVDSNNSIGENIQKVAAFSDTAGSTFADGVRLLITFANASSDDISGSIKNIQALSDEHSFTRGTTNIRRLGDGNIEHGIENVLKLGGAMTPDSAVNAALTEQSPKPQGDVAAATAALRAAGDGSIEKGIDAVIAFGETNKPAGAKSALEGAIANFMSLGINEPVQLQAMAIAGSGRLSDGLQRIQQYGGFEKLSQDFDGNLISGAQYLRKQHAGEASKYPVDPVSELQPGRATSQVAALPSGQPGTAAHGKSQAANGQQFAEQACTSDKPFNEETDDERGFDNNRHLIYAPPTTTGPAAPSSILTFQTWLNLMLARLSDASIQRTGLDSSALPPGADTRSTKTGGSRFGIEFATALIDVSRIGRLLGTTFTSPAFTASLAFTASPKFGGNTSPEFSVRQNGATAIANTPTISTPAVVHMVADGRNVSAAVSAYQFALNMQKSTPVIDAAVTRVNANAGSFDGKYVKGQEIPIRTALTSASKSANIVIVALPINTNGGGQMPSQFTDARISRQYPVRGGIVDAATKPQQLIFAGRLGLCPSKKLALIGPEVALAALLVSAGVARVRGAAAVAETHLTVTDAEVVRLDTDPDAQLQLHKYEPRMRPTWLVRSNEDLCALADHLFHDARLGWLIADLNHSNTIEIFDGPKRVVELRARQKIELPVWQDIVEFHKQRIDFHTKDLVTVVTETAIDQELMHELMQLTLAPIIGTAAPAVVVAPVTAVAAEVHPLPNLNTARLAESASRLATSAKTALSASTKAALVAMGQSTLGTKQDPTAVATVTDLAHARN